MKFGILAVAGMALAASSAMAQVELVGSVPATFMDISGTGLSVFGSGTGDIPVDVTTTIGNRVFPAGALRIWENGALAWLPGPTTGLNAINSALPASGPPHPNFGPGQYLLPYWDDLDLRPPVGQPDPGNRGVFFQEIGDLAIIQWNNIGTFPASAERATFQVQIVRGAAGVNFFAQMLYDDRIDEAPFSGGASATVGYVDGDAGQNRPAGANEQWSFDGTGNPLVGSAVITVIPAPGTAALLGLGALMLGRRRRA